MFQHFLSPIRRRNPFSDDRPTEDCWRSPFSVPREKSPWPTTLTRRERTIELLAKGASRYNSASSPSLFDVVQGICVACKSYCDTKPCCICQQLACNNDSQQCSICVRVCCLSCGSVRFGYFLSTIAPVLRLTFDVSRLQVGCCVSDALLNMLAM